MFFTKHLNIGENIDKKITISKNVGKKGGGGGGGVGYSPLSSLTRTP